MYYQPEDITVFGAKGPGLFIVAAPVQTDKTKESIMELQIELGQLNTFSKFRLHLSERQLLFDHQFSANPLEPGHSTFCIGK